MKNKKEYEAVFFDYYGNEFLKLTKKFDNFYDAKVYSIETLNNDTIPLFKLYRDGTQIKLDNGRETAQEDSRR